MLSERLKDYVHDLRQRGLYRQRECLAEDETLINFSSNDYLSISRDPSIKKAYQLGFERYPTGSGGSMVVCGYHSMHRDLEKAFSEALRVDDCLVFSSGYAANLSVMALLQHLEVPILIDKGVHASIYAGLQGSSFKRYHHQDLVDLNHKLTTISPILVTESIFSMSGQLAPLSNIAEISKDKVQGIIVDEAHAFGVIGSEGMGGVCLNGLTQETVPLRIIPLGKAFSASGAVVAGHAAWVDALLQSSKPYVYSTAISPACAYGLLETLTFIRNANERRAHLNDLVTYFRSKVEQSSLPWRDSVTPIQQLQLGCPNKALSLAKSLRTASIMCVPMREPTVSRKETGLRLILNYLHQPEHIDYLFRVLHAAEY